MTTRIDFRLLPKDGETFEALVRQLLEAMGFIILEPPATGPDGGRDILVERVLADILGERRERIVVQCKHRAHSGKPVGPSALGVWQNSLALYDAQGYLLVTSGTVTESLNKVFLAFSNKPNQLAIFWDRAKLIELLSVHIEVRDRFFAPLEVNLETDLSKQGWGVIYPEGACDKIRLALAPLLQLRKAQVEQRAGKGIFREFHGVEGYRRGETAHDFLARHGVGPGTPDPSRVPFFLMLIGEPTDIPFSFQVSLGVQYAVARLTFSTPSEYGNYAQRVVRVHQEKPSRPREMTLLAVENADDIATALSTKFVSTLHADLSNEPSTWSIRMTGKKGATKERMREILCGSRIVDLIFIAAHGLRLRPGHPERRNLEGAIITEDWPGSSAWRGALSPDHYFGAADIAVDTKLQGSFVFLFACSSVGASADDSPIFNEWIEPLASGLFDGGRLQSSH